jgi:hypothetical protein
LDVCHDTTQKVQEDEGLTFPQAVPDPEWIVKENEQSRFLQDDNGPLILNLMERGITNSLSPVRCKSSTLVPSCHITWPAMQHRDFFHRLSLGGRPRERQHCQLGSRSRRYSSETQWISWFILSPTGSCCLMTRSTRSMVQRKRESVHSLMESTFEFFGMVS